MTDYTGPLSLLEIHLDQVLWNYLSLQKRLKEGADCAAVIKADAYGLGAAVIAPALYQANCRHFYVANVAEGVAVRATLKGQPAQVYVLHGPWGAPSEEIAAQGLVPVLNTPSDIAHWSSFAQKSGKKQSCVIHLDTGMNRLGLSAAELARLEVDTDVLKLLDIRYVMSHLACADESRHPKNKEQLERFRRLTQQLKLPCRLSFANSAGIFLGSDYHFDQVRPGCALYGINPAPLVPNPMQAVVTLKARILQIREVVAGETVGYGATYRVSSPVRLAIVSLGYADGYLRSIAGSGVVYIRGHKCAVIGRVSMDLIAVDVTQITPLPQSGAWAEIIGKHQTVDDLAAQARTIGYEVMTALGRRYTRVYSGQGQT